jgi:hypothetical protein
MKTIYLIVLLSACKVSFAQNWILLEGSKIEYISVVDRGDTIVFFKKDSAVIAMPPIMLNDFRLLFLQDQHSFDMINDSCVHFRTFMISDSVEKIFKNYGIEHIVYITKREIKETNDEEIWILITPYGQGQPCWPYIFIRRLRNKSTPIKFLSIRRGACEI